MVRCRTCRSSKRRSAARTAIRWCARTVCARGSGSWSVRLTMVKGRSSAMMSHAELRFFFFAEQFMSMAMAQKRVWTIEEVERLIDEREGHTPRYELVDGELLVTPAPSF